MLRFPRTREVVKRILDISKTAEMSESAYWMPM